MLFSSNIHLWWSYDKDIYWDTRILFFSRRSIPVVRQASELAQQPMRHSPASGILYLLICAKHLVFQTFTSIYPDKTCFNSLAAAGLLLRLCWNVGPICQNRETLDWCPRTDRHFTPRDDGRWWHRHYGEWILSLLHHTIPVFDVHSRQSVKIKIGRMCSNLSVTS